MDEVVLDQVMAERLAKAAGEFGTPCYVTDLDVVDDRARELSAAFPSPWILQYSLKANPLPSIVARLAADGLGANVVSAGEWNAALAAGLGNHQISLEGIGKADIDLAAAVQAAAAGDPLRWVTLESTDEADRLSEITRMTDLAAYNLNLDVLFRLNPAVVPETSVEFQVGAKHSKFGMSEPEIKSWLHSNLGKAPGLRVRGVHVHVGSQLTGTAAWTEAAVRACRLVKDLSVIAPSVDTVDLGGGFPAGEVPRPSPIDFRVQFEESLDEAGLVLPGRVAVEPGRFLVATAGWIVSRVLHVREHDDTQQVVIDASFAELMRPVLYGARHAVLAIVERPSREERRTLVEGALCESTDTFGWHQLPRLSRGDLVALAGAGAYASSMFSHYNGRPRPPEVVVSRGSGVRLARAGSAFSP